MGTNKNISTNPLAGLDEWEEDVLGRYPDPETIAKVKRTMNSEIMKSR